MMLSTYLMGALLSLSTSALPQGPNNLAMYNPNIRTMGINGSFFLVPVDTAAVQKAVPYPLLDITTIDTSLFPNGFPAGKHPVFVQNTYGSDIRMSALEIDALLNGAVYVPFVDRLRDGKTEFTFPLFTVAAGTPDEPLGGAVPAVVGSLTSGQTILLGSFLPDDAAWQEDAPGVFSAGTKVTVVPNPISGPGVSPAFFELSFSTATNALYPEKTFRRVINLPVIGNTGLCSYNAYYFNDTFSSPTLRSGSVTLYSPPLAAGLGGIYKNAGGFTAAGQTVGYTPTTCAKAAGMVDPGAIA